MIYLILFGEFFKTGLLAVGGGLATLPFVYDIAARYDWLRVEDVTNMIAVAESTPGPIGLNVATFAGYHASGILGSLVATVALILPSMLAILLVSHFLSIWQEHRLVKATFWSLRPAALGLIGAAFITVIRQVFILPIDAGAELLFFKRIRHSVRWLDLLFFIALFPAIKFLKLHPLIWVLFAAGVGIAYGYFF